MHPWQWSMPTAALAYKSTGVYMCTLIS